MDDNTASVIVALAIFTYLGFLVWVNRDKGGK